MKFWCIACRVGERAREWRLYGIHNEHWEFRWPDYETASATCDRLNNYWKDNGNVYVPFFVSDEDET